MTAYPRQFVLVSLCLYGGVGLGFLFAPERLGAIAGMDLSAPMPRVDVRAVYGGLDLGMAAFLGWCLRHPSRIEAGVVAATLGLVGFATARVVGMILDGPDSTNALFLLIEALSAGAGAIAWRACSRQQPAAGS